MAWEDTVFTKVLGDITHMDCRRIAICIPCYNREGTLGEALDSLVSQKGALFDIHVFDNASTDGTQALVTENYLNRVVYHRNESNLGYVGNIQKCFELKSDYDWIGLLHSDDRHEGESVALALAYIAKYPDAGLVFSKINWMSESGEIFSRAAGSHHVYGRGREAVERCQSQLPCSTIFYNSRALDHVGFFDPAYPYSADEEHNARIARQFDIVESAEVFASYRRHEGHLMTQTWLKDDFMSNFEGMRLKMAGYAGMSGVQALERVRRDLGAIFLECAFDLVAHSYQRHALRYFLYSWRWTRNLTVRPRVVIKIALAMIPWIGPKIIAGIIERRRRTLVP